ncbi:type II toxin-antitoxin system RelB family antitoxin [Treponema maltophilum]|jgi:copG domain protein DNA-binding domain protein|uniref:type II toxin-antitoxin system RelB family antitoxin n=1 Tax=Treponema maltophilum TaxID=51160 RepID=UPI003D8B4808
MTEAVVTKFDVDTIERLTVLAEMTGKTKSYYIKKAVNEKLEDMELLYLAKSRLEDLKAGRSSTISLEEIKEKYGL